MIRCDTEVQRAALANLLWCAKDIAVMRSVRKRREAAEITALSDALDDLFEALGPHPEIVGLTERKER